MENYEGISVMSTGDECSIQHDISASSSDVVPSSVLEQLTSAVDVDVKQPNSLASRVFLVSDKSHIDALQVRHCLYGTPCRSNSIAYPHTARFVVVLKHFCSLSFIVDIVQ